MKRTYVVAREGFLMNTYKKVGDKVVLSERQAEYLIRGGQLSDPTKPPVKSVAERAKDIFAEAAAASPPAADPGPEPVEPEPDPEPAA